MVAKKYQNPAGGLNEAGRKYFKRTTGANLKRPSKKVLMAEIEQMGVDKTIVASLARANIDTMQFVKDLVAKSQ